MRMCRGGSAKMSAAIVENCRLCGWNPSRKPSAPRQRKRVSTCWPANCRGLLPRGCTTPVSCTVRRAPTLSPRLGVGIFGRSSRSIAKYYLRERGSAAVVYHRRPPSWRRGASSCSSIFWRLSWTPTQRWTPNWLMAPRAARFACRARTRCPSTQWTRCCLERRLCSTCQCR